MTVTASRASSTPGWWSAGAAGRGTMRRLAESCGVLERGRALCRQTRQMVERSRARLAATLAALEPVLVPSNEAQAPARPQADRCATAGCTAEARHGVYLVAIVGDVELTLKRLSMRVCSRHRAAVTAAMDDPRLAALWRANLELRLARTVDLRSIRAVFTSER